MQERATTRTGLTVQVDILDKVYRTRPRKGQRNRQGCREAAPGRHPATLELPHFTQCVKLETYFARCSKAASGCRIHEDDFAMVGPAAALASWGFQQTECGVCLIHRPGPAGTPDCSDRLMTRTSRSELTRIWQESRVLGRGRPRGRVAPARGSPWAAPHRRAPPPGRSCTSHCLRNDGGCRSRASSIARTSFFPCLDLERLLTLNRYGGHKSRSLGMQVGIARGPGRVDREDAHERMTSVGAGPTPRLEGRKRGGTTRHHNVTR